jgi:biopolymer transport protein ExbB/TolQ
MRLVVLVCTVAVFFIVIALLYQWGKRDDSMHRRFAMVGDTERAYNDTELKKSFSERVFQPMVKQFSERIRRLAEEAKPQVPAKGTSNWRSS